MDRGRGYQRGRGRGRGDWGREETRSCFLCGRPGHIRINCPDEMPREEDGDHRGQKQKAVVQIASAAAPDKNEDSEEVRKLWERVENLEKRQSQTPEVDFESDRVEKVLRTLLASKTNGQGAKRLYNPFDP